MLQRNSQALCRTFVAKALLLVSIAGDILYAPPSLRRYIQVNSTSGAEVSLMVLAVVKMPAPLLRKTLGGGPAYTSCQIIRIVTYVGTITVSGSVGCRCLF